MRNWMFLASALSIAATGCVFQGESSNGQITIDNLSSHVLLEVRVAPVDQASWGPNLLPDVLYPNERLTILVACDTYDVLISDDRSRDCVLAQLDLCFSNDLWTIDDATLRSCGF